MRRFFWGTMGCVATSFILVVGSALGGGDEDVATAVSEEAYANLMANEVLDIQDLADGAEIQRRMFNRMTPAGFSWFQPMFPSVAPFDSKYFDEAFLDDLLGEETNSVAVYPLSLVLDPKTRETLVYNAEGKLIATVPSDGVSRSWPEEADPTRVTLQIDLLPSEYAEPYLYAGDKIAQAEAFGSSKSAKIPKVGGFALKSLGSGEFGFADAVPMTNGGFIMTVTNGTDMAEIYSFTIWHTSSVVVVIWTNDQNEVITDTNIVWTPISPPYSGLENEWVAETTNLPLTNGVGVWVDTNAPAAAKTRSYAAAKREDGDGDGLSSGTEIFISRTDPGKHDTDDDGLDDGHEIRAGSNPTNALPATGLNRNWMYFNNSGFASPSWELAPGLWQRFEIANYAAGTNSLFVVLPQNLVMDPGGTNTVGVRFWAPGMEDSRLPASLYASTVISASNKFHGLPTMGSATVNVYRLDYRQPQTTNRCDIWYCPFIQSYSNGVKTDETWLIDGRRGNGDSTNGFGSNNWLNAAQYYGSGYTYSDYCSVFDPNRLQNGDFENGDDCWSMGGTNAQVSTQYAVSGTSSLVAMNRDGLAYQNIGVHPGEELVLSGYILNPSTNSADPHPLGDGKYASMSLEYYDGIDSDKMAYQEATLVNGATQDVWHYFAVTSLVPSGARSANISLRTVYVRGEETESHVYFDDVRIAVSPDSDVDGMPDWWETRYGLDPQDPQDAIGDMAGSEMLNIEKYRLRLDPADADTDGDGMPDWWELAHGLDPWDGYDAMQDYDGDGLTNLQEYALGTNPRLADTDGDGLDDGTEVLDCSSNPLATDLAAFNLVQEIDGASPTGLLGSWAANGTSLYAQDRRGYAEYQWTAGAPDVYRIEIEANDHVDFAGWRNYELRIEIDGTYVGRHHLWSSGNAPGTVAVLTPWLNPGTHTIRIFWDNAASYKSLQIRRILVQRISGPDANGNGVSDWVDSRLARLSRADTNRLDSVISPACMEGDDPYVSLMSISGGIAVCQGAGSRWYANVPLNPTSAVNPVVSFQSGGRSVTNQISWVPHNVLLDGDLAIRKNDVLMLAAYPSGATNGTIVVNIQGVAAYTAGVGQVITHAFAATGTYSIAGTYTPVSGPPVDGSIQIEVLDASFPESPACWIDVLRQWVVPGLSTNVEIEYDGAMRMWEVEDGDDASRMFQNELYLPEEHFILARAGSGGPVITNLPLRGFRLAYSTDAHYSTVAVCDTGDQLIESLAVLEPVLPDLTFKGEIIVGGVLYENGSISNEWDAADFNELGELPVRFWRSAYSETAVCNLFDVCQGTNVIGRYNVNK